MDAEEFLSYRSSYKTGVSKWLRGLSFNEPTLVPNEFGDRALARKRVYSAAQSTNVRVSIRTIDGALWAMKSEKESN